jgi:hypothetical protein
MVIPGPKHPPWRPSALPNTRVIRVPSALVILQHFLQLPCEAVPLG